MSADFRELESAADNPPLLAILHDLQQQGLLRDWVKNRLWTDAEREEYAAALFHLPDVVAKAKAVIDKGTPFRRDEVQAWVHASMLWAAWISQFHECATEIAESIAASKEVVA